MSTAYDVAVDAIKAGLPRCHERLRTDIYKGAQPGVRSDLRITSEAKAAALGAPARKRTTGRDILRALENRHRWLLFAQHCYTCQLPDGACELGKLCTYGKKTLKHVSHCEAERDECPYPRCRLLKPLLSHSRSCQAANCAICVPVWNYIQKDMPATAGGGAGECWCACADFNSSCCDAGSMRVARAFEALGLYVWS
eukprot:XP_001699417.1 predicted protein [Chlamydomonas reinhardtii]